MFTQCPRCATHFRVTSTQLKARAGNVRCGQCNFVFNALDNLLQSPTVAPIVDETISMDLPFESAAPIGEKKSPVADPAVIGESIINEPEKNVAVADAAQNIRSVTAIDVESYAADPLLHASPIRQRRWPWVVGSVIAVIGLFLQAVYYYRTELAVLRPDLRPYLQSACQSLRCEVQRPRQIETLGIDASDLHPEPQQTGRLTLTATLRSKAPYAQEWPTLELTLTDVTDGKLAVKSFTANEYLPQDKNQKIMLASGFPAKGEVALNLPLDIGDLPAAGYRVYIYYP